MASGKQSKRRRREAEAAMAVPAGRVPGRGGRPRKASVAVPGGRRQASPKVLIAIGVAVAVIAAIVVAVVVLSGGSSSSSAAADLPARGTLTNALPGAPEVAALFKGIPQQGRTLGAPNAPVTLVEYADLQCPYCREFEARTLPELVTRYVRKGVLRVDTRPIAFLGPDSERGQLAALAAARQNRFYNFTALMYFNQGTENTGWLDDDMVARTAASIPGVDVQQLLADRKSPAVRDAADTVTGQARADRVSRTPTILVGRTGGQLQQVALTSPDDVASVAAAIAAARGR